MCFIELVDYNTTYVTDKKDSGQAKRTRRGASKAKAETTAEVKPKVAKQKPAEETPTTEENA
jgi:large subunit ribosomal protein L17